MLDKFKRLSLAREQLDRVRVAAVDPGDWSDLAVYGSYALQNAIAAAADHLGVSWSEAHISLMRVAQVLAKDYGLLDVSPLVSELRDIRNSQAYEAGEDPDEEAGPVVLRIEEFVDAVAALIGSVV